MGGLVFSWVPIEDYSGVAFRHLHLGFRDLGFRALVLGLGIRVRAYNLGLQGFCLGK